MLFLVLCTFSEDEQVWIEQLFNENHTLLDAEDAVAQAFLNIMEHFEKSASYHAATRFPIVLLLQRMHPMIFFVRRKR